MGETVARLRFRGTRRAEPVTLELLVDTGSIFSWIDGRVLKALGVRPARRWQFRTMEGRLVARDVGDAFVENRGDSAPTVVVFATRTDAHVLGLHALESFGLQVDPVSGRLRKARDILALHGGGRPWRNGSPARVGG